jgi:hypothetical protein
VTAHLRCCGDPPGQLQQRLRASDEDHARPDDLDTDVIAIVGVADLVTVG